MRPNEIPDDYVQMERAICPVCGIKHEHGGILISKHLRSIPEKQTVTHYALCPDHQKLFDDGYVALVGIDPAKSTSSSGRMELEDAYRTGRLAHLRRSAYARFFPDNPIDDDLPLVFVDDEVIDMLMAAESTRVQHEETLQ